MKALFHARVILVSLVLLYLIPSSGCRSTPRFGRGIGLGGNGLAKHGGECEGGVCSGPTAHGASGQTPAELFAAMNADGFEQEIVREAKNAERIALVPDGPGSLFAPYR